MRRYCNCRTTFASTPICSSVPSKPRSGCWTTRGHPDAADNWTVAKEMLLRALDDPTSDLRGADHVDSWFRSGEAW